ncbi:cell surface glycoprotein 1 isoform X1 [Micropterus dolomieu]|uniref:cell surface glycoprotein 1 isoform X1 n=1 Tax=Micropterus dolomieu TaxID=147949 RepID=UPI001E8CE4D3|nr:cell surface glycoprotein 1 isoform X1 [Micropterus dolomieu]
MMSYLWILLLGSLLAAGAKAQDEVAVEEEASGTPVPEVGAAPGVNGEPATDEETHHTAEDPTPAVSEPTTKPTIVEVNESVDPADGAAEQTTPADGYTEPVTPADGDAQPTTPAVEGSDPVTPADGDAEPTTPAVEGSDPVTPDDGGTDQVTPAAAATTQEPAPEETTLSTGTTLAQESGHNDEATPTTDPAAEDNEKQPTDVDRVESVTRHAVQGAAPNENTDVGLNLNKVTSEPNPAKPGKSRIYESGPQAAGAIGDADQPKTQGASSGSLAGIVSAIAVAVVGAVVGYFTYQKKKLCFKNRQEQDPEAARKADPEAQSNPQVLSNLLNSS